MKTRVLLALVFMITTVSSAEAAFQGYGEFYAGAWRGYFSQSGFGHSMRTVSSISPGLQAILGAKFGPVIVEYPLQWFTSHWGARDGSYTGASNEMTYFSLLSLNAGVEVPGIGLSPYVGYGTGNLTFSYGSNTRFSSDQWRFGASLKLAGPENASVRLRVEYQIMPFQTDEGGDAPAGVTSEGNIWFIGIGFGGGR